MNNRKLIAHKGMYNEIKFDIRNRDRKLQNVFSESLSATLVNPTTKRRIFTKLLEHTSDVGQVKLVLEEGDLRNVEEGLYTIYVSMTKADGYEYPVYTDPNSSVKFQIEIDAQIKNEPVPTQLANTFTSIASTSSVTLLQMYLLQVHCMVIRIEILVMHYIVLLYIPNCIHR